MPRNPNVSWEVTEPISIMDPRPLKKGGTTLEPIHYVCTQGHHSILRTTTMRPDPDRWAGSACGYCLREGVDSVMRRETYLENLNKHAVKALNDLLKF